MRPAVLLAALAVLLPLGPAGAQETELRNVREARRTEPVPDLLDAADELLDAVWPDDRLGAVVRERPDGLEVLSVLPFSRAAQAGLRAGDLVRTAGDRSVDDPADLRGLAGGVELGVRRGERTVAVRVPLARGDDRPLEGTLRLAVVLVDFPDVRRPDRGPEHWERLVFGEGTADRPSVRSYYEEVSGGRLAVEGRVFDWLRFPRARSTFAETPAFVTALQAPLYADALDLLRDREGVEALDGYDGVAFVIAGDRGDRGSILWPHSSYLPDGDVLRRYYVVDAGADDPVTVGVHCHELGHVFGLLDKYGFAHRSGVGPWCAMSIGHHGGAHPGGSRPFHLCAVCKWRLGWIDPVTVDPRDPQELWLGPVEGSTDQVLRVLLDPAGRESFFVVHRASVGTDRGLPGTGVLIWHVGEWGQRIRNQIWAYDIDLEEAHGRDGPHASHEALDRVPFGRGHRTSFTPETDPPSTTNRPDAWPVRITNIRVEGDRASLRIGPGE